MTMTPRRKAKQASGGAESAKLTRKKGKTEDATTTPTGSPSDVRRSQRRSTVHTSSPQNAQGSASKKTRQAGLSPETPLRVSPRGKRESSSPSILGSSTTPTRRGQKKRRDSTDSSASSVGNASVNCATMPVSARTRRESNSSAVSETSDTSLVTPTTPQRGGGSKRKLPGRTSTESSKRAQKNGPTPQYSPSPKRRRNLQGGISPSSTNGGSEDRLRPRRTICEISPPQKDLDGDINEQEACMIDEKSDAKNCMDNPGPLKNINLKVEEVGSDAKMKGGACVPEPENVNSDGNLDNGLHEKKEESELSLNSKDLGALAEKESCKVNTDVLDVLSLSESQSDTEPRTSTDSGHEIPCTATHTDKAAVSSSHVKSAKRRHSSGGNSSACVISEYTQATKKAKQCASVCDSGNVKCEKDVESDAAEKRNEEVARCSDSLYCSDMDPKINIVGANEEAKKLLNTFDLTDEQSQEICSLLTMDALNLPESRLIEELVETLLHTSASVQTMNAPRFNKFLRQLLAHYCCLDTPEESKDGLCEKAVQWARDRKSVNLRHELELTLMSLYYNTSQYKKAERIANDLYIETKKLQDKEKTVKACLCLSQVYHAMGNISKARANITTAKTEALKIYTPPDMQGELDLQSGIMQVAEGKDMETAYSYFKEAATGSVSRKQRARALKYMLLSKIMVNRSEEGEKAVCSSSHIQDIDDGVEAMLAIAGAANKSSLKEFRRLREVHQKHLAGDRVVAGILDDLYTAMMEKNLLNIVLPFERIQIGHIAEKIGLPREEVERRISQMILDKRINAQLDHRDDCLYVYAAEDSDTVYQMGIKTVAQLDKTISHLNRKVKKLL